MTCGLLQLAKKFQQIYLSVAPGKTFTVIMELSEGAFVSLYAEP